MPRYWNHRVIRFDTPEESYHQIHEVYYDDAYDGSAITGWTARAVAAGGETLEELARDHAAQARALLKPVLIATELPGYDARDYCPRTDPFEGAEDPFELGDPFAGPDDPFELSP